MKATMILFLFLFTGSLHAQTFYEESGLAFGREVIYEVNRPWGAGGATLYRHFEYIDTYRADTAIMSYGTVKPLIDLRNANNRFKHRHSVAEAEMSEDNKYIERGVGIVNDGYYSIISDIVYRHLSEAELDGLRDKDYYEPRFFVILLIDRKKGKVEEVMFGFVEHPVPMSITPDRFYAMEQELKKRVRVEVPEYCTKDFFEIVQFVRFNFENELQRRTFLVEEERRLWNFNRREILRQEKGE